MANALARQRRAGYTPLAKPPGARSGASFPCVVGFRVGFDIDLHLQRCFLGWGFSYEYLAHTRGSIRYSHFLAWNLIPVFRMGVVIGRRVQRQPPKYAPFGYGKGSR